MIKEKSTESDLLNISDVCDAVGVARSTFYRRTADKTNAPEHQKKSSPRKLSEQEEERVLAVLNSERFYDFAPGEIHATLLDESIYLCSERTMYRILERNNQNVQRRQKTGRNYARPELLATHSNQLWSWDITKLKGPRKWTYYYLYKIMDVYSRYVVGWMVAPRESAELAKLLIEQTCIRQGIEEDQLTLHADRGSSMKSIVVGQLLADLGVTKTHSRPHVSNDNPYSESLFKTLKYRPEFPELFGSIEDARLFCVDFFEWYNTSHKHSGIAMLTPENVHYDNIEEIVSKRQIVMNEVYKKHSQRFVKGITIIKKPDAQVWINKPQIDGLPLRSVA